MHPFNNEQIPARLQKALQKMNYENPTPIQEAAIPIALKGGDLIGCAQTGTGKTAAFGIPVIAKSIEQSAKQSLILAPTRELAAQIQKVLQDLAQYSSFVRSVLLVGGASMRKQFQDLRRNPSIIVATPGRLADHLRRGSVDLSQTSTIVLDEADRMLDMGFGPQVEEIFEYLPKERQVLLFSATLPPKIMKLAREFLNKPESVSIGSLDRPIAKIEQLKIAVEGRDKEQQLLEEINTRRSKTIIFTRTKRRADKLTKFLFQNGIDAGCIHGDRSQSQREKAIADFRKDKKMVMIATDIASRGLDVDSIKVVINFDLPDTAEDFIHRVGRTGRAGQEGIALSFVTPEENRHWKYLQDPKDKSGQKMVQQRGGNQGKRRPRPNFGGARYGNERNVKTYSFKPRGESKRYSSRAAS